MSDSDSEYTSYISESLQTPSVVVEDEGDADVEGGETSPKTQQEGNRQQQQQPNKTTRRKKKRTKKRSAGEIEVTRSLSEEEDQNPKQQRQQQPQSTTPSPQKNQLRSSRGSAGQRHRLKKPLESDGATADQAPPPEPSHHVGFGASGEQDAATGGLPVSRRASGTSRNSQLRPSPIARAVSHVTLSSRPQSAVYSMMGDGESLLKPDEGALAAKQTLSNIGAMSLTKGAMEERLKVLENQVERWLSTVSS